ncbi:MAG: DUF4129 domain-containing protein [Pirellulaceae bacterium]
MRVELMARATGVSCFVAAVLATAVMLGVAPASRACAAEDPVEAPVEATRDALNGPVNFPWYDAETDSLRRINVREQRDDAAANRASKWEATPSGGGAAAPTGNYSFDWLASLAKAFIVVIGVLLAVGLVWLLIWAFLKGEAALAKAAGKEEDEEVEETDVERIERLPFQVDRPQTDLLGEARRQYEAGNFAEAVIYYFSYQLVQLDKHHWIRLAKGKTNRQYLREVRQQAALREMLEATMFAFEDVFFGHHPLSRDRFENVWRRLDEFQSQVQQTGA